jgi:uncharacterized protein (UPF0335 family)
MSVVDECQKVINKILNIDAGIKEVATEQKAVLKDAKEAGLVIGVIKKMVDYECYPDHRQAAVDHNMILMVYQQALGVGKDPAPKAEPVKAPKPVKEPKPVKAKAKKPKAKPKPTVVDDSQSLAASGVESTSDIGAAEVVTTPAT